MKILQWNINGVIGKLHELRQLIALYNPTLICLQETRLKPHQLFHLKNYTIYRADHTDGAIASDGVATLIHDSVLATDLNIASTFQNTTLQIKFATSSSSSIVNICNMYLPPDQQASHQDLQNCLPQIPEPILLLGDLNAHSPRWDPLSRRTNSKGKSVEKILDNNPNLVLLNTGESTRFNARDGTFSAIDLTIASIPIAQKFIWSVHHDLCSSDHFPIIISNETSHQKPVRKFPKWQLENVYWERFSEVCSNIHLDPSRDNINVVLQKFNNEILQAASVSVPVLSLQLTEIRCHGGPLPSNRP